MTYWLKARVAWLPPVTAAVVVAACMLIGGIALPVPSLEVGAAIPFAVMLPLAFAVTLAVSLQRKDIEFELVAVRCVHLYDLGLAMAACAVGGTISLATWMVDPDEAVVIAGRNIVGFAAVVLILARLVGLVAAPAVLGLYLVFCAVAGGSRDDHGPLWSWPVNQSGDVAALAIALGLMVLAAIIWIVSPPRREYGILPIS